MPIGYTNHFASSRDGASQTFVTTSFTPPDNSLLVVMASSLLSGGRAAAPTITDSVGLTWSIREDVTFFNGVSSMVAIWTAPVAVGASMTVTVNYQAVNLTNTQCNRVMTVASLTGDGKRLPRVRRTLFDGGTAGRAGVYAKDFAGDFASADSYAFSAMVNDNNVASVANATPGAAWTQIYELPVAGTFVSSLHQYRTGSTSKTVDMVLFTTDGAFSWGIAAVEIVLDVANKAPKNIGNEDEAGWFEELTQASSWWGNTYANISGWFDQDLAVPTVAGVTTPQVVSATSTTTSSVVNKVGKIVAATSTTTSAMARQVGKIVSATGTTTSSVVKQAKKIVSATSTTTSAIVNQVKKIISATATTTSVLTANKRTLQVISATATTTSTVLKQVGKIVSATGTTTSTVVKRAGKIVSATGTTTSTVGKLVGKAISATATTTSTVVKRVGKAIAATATSTSAAVKRVGKVILSTATSSSILTAIPTYLSGAIFPVVLSATATTTSTMKRAIGKLVNVSAVSTSTLVKTISKSISVVVISTAFLTLSAFIALLQLTDRFIRTFEAIRSFFTKENSRVIVTIKDDRVLKALEASRTIFDVYEPRIIFTKFEDDTIVTEVEDGSLAG